MLQSPGHQNNFALDLGTQMFMRTQRLKMFERVKLSPSNTENFAKTFGSSFVLRVCKRGAEEEEKREGQRGSERQETDRQTDR